VDSKCSCLQFGRRKRVPEKVEYYGVRTETQDIQGFEMTKEIRLVDEKRGIVQITTLGERFYAKTETDPETGLPETMFRPSVTFIVDYYPKGPGFMKWVKANGEESDEIARLAADRGYKAHLALGLLNQGGEGAKIDWRTDRFMNPTTGREELLATDEWAAVLSYVDWWRNEGRLLFKIVAAEFVTWPNPEGLANDTGYPIAAFLYAGTVDLKLEQTATRQDMIDAGYKGWKHEKGSIGIVDFKTSKDIWPSHKMQCAAYAVSEGAEWAFTLQLNYQRTKTKRWKVTVIDVKHFFRLFMSTKNIWNEENEGIEPLQRDYPLEVTLGKEVIVP
jgi:hypothetical protein